LAIGFWQAFLRLKRTATPVPLREIKRAVVDLVSSKVADRR
jgi:hypothetical protein